MIKRMSAVWALLLFAVSIMAQTPLERISELPEAYVSLRTDAAGTDAISSRFTIDRAVNSGDGIFDVRIWLPRSDFRAFDSMGMAYEIVQPGRAYVSMANSYEEMAASWSSYPTYQAYVQIMQKFQNDYPDLCKIDTILTSTPNGHAVLCAHISSDVNSGGKPSVLYSSTIHGDEPVGYYMLIRLIDKLLSEYSTHQSIKQLVDNNHIWICPLHNPDGTYYTADNILNEWPVSTRSNSHNVDLNRSFPLVSGPVAKAGYEPEVEAMMQFMENHNFTLAANLHGGAEVFNYPWDTWMSWQRQHPDHEWWDYVGRAFADTCHKYSANSYMTDVNDGVTPGGDWYVITGSMQDYHNFYLGARHVTIEVGREKVIASYLLPSYWNYICPSLLNFIAEAGNGIQGTVTDSLTGAPLKATVFVEGHDADHSYVESSLPFGDYHRPVKAGHYAVTYSAPGYVYKTIEVDVSDGAATVQDVQLVKYVGIAEFSGSFEVYPNPATDNVHIKAKRESGEPFKAKLYDIQGRFLSVVEEDGSFALDVSALAAGTYILRFFMKSGIEEVKFVKN